MNKCNGDGNGYHDLCGGVHDDDEMVWCGNEGCDVEWLPKKEVCFCRSKGFGRCDICTCECCEHEETMMGNRHLFNRKELIEKRKMLDGSLQEKRGEPDSRYADLSSERDCYTKKEMQKFMESLEEKVDRIRTRDRLWKRDLLDYLAEIPVVGNKEHSLVHKMWKDLCKKYT